MADAFNFCPIQAPVAILLDILDCYRNSEYDHYHSLYRRLFPDDEARLAVVRAFATVWSAMDQQNGLFKRTGQISLDEFYKSFGIHDYGEESNRTHARPLFASVLKVTPLLLSILTFTHREPLPRKQTVIKPISFATGTRAPTSFEKLGYYDIYPYTVADDKASIRADSSYLQEFSLKITSFTDYIDEISQDGQKLSSFMARFTTEFATAVYNARLLTTPRELRGKTYSEKDVDDECTPYMEIIRLVSNVILFASALQLQMPISEIEGRITREIKYTSFSTSQVVTGNMQTGVQIPFLKQDGRITADIRSGPQNLTDERLYLLPVELNTEIQTIIQGPSQGVLGDNTTERDYYNSLEYPLMIQLLNDQSGDLRSLTPTNLPLFTIVQQIVRYILFNCSDNVGLVFCYWNGKPHILEVMIEINTLDYTRDSEGLWKVDLPTNKRDVTRTVSVRGAKKEEKVRISEKKIPISLKLHCVEGSPNANPALTPPIMTIVHIGRVLEKLAVNDGQKKKQAVACSLKRKSLHRQGCNQSNDPQGSEPETSSKRRKKGYLSSLRNFFKGTSSVTQPSKYGVTNFNLILHVWSEEEKFLDYDTKTLLFCDCSKDCSPMLQGASTHLLHTLSKYGFEFIIRDSILDGEFENFRASTLIIDNCSLKRFLVDETEWSKTDKESRSFKSLLTRDENDINDNDNVPLPGLTASSEVRDIINSTEKSVIKFYNISALEYAFAQSSDLQESFHDDLTNFEESYHDLYETEISCLQMMNNFNLSNRTMIKLHVPRILSKGDQFEIYYGKWMMNGYIGPYLMTEFISQDKAWKYLLPLPQSKIDVFKREIEILIKELGIRHGDLSLSNMIYHEGDVYLIDFGMSWMLHDEDRADRELVDELLEEDQKKVQSLLGNAYGYRRNYY